MTPHIDPNDPRDLNATAEILGRHDNGDPKANITSAVRDFLIITGLARGEEMVNESPTSGGPRLSRCLPSLDAVHQRS